jgi:hypothetical protein
VAKTLQKIDLERGRPPPMQSLILACQQLWIQPASGDAGGSLGCGPTHLAPLLPATAAPDARRRCNEGCILDSGSPGCLVLSKITPPIFMGICRGRFEED